jgi:hypothetical protein
MGGYNMQPEEFLTSAPGSATRDGRALNKRVRRTSRDRRFVWMAVRRSLAWKKLMSFFGGMVRAVILVVGVLLIIVGIPVTPMPIPLGLPMVITGFLMVASVSPGLQKWIRRKRGSNPKLDERIMSARDKVPGFIRKLIDLTAPKDRE